jgi:hypothetical protein
VLYCLIAFPDYLPKACHEPSAGVVDNLEFKMKKKKEYVQGTPEKEARCLAYCLRPTTRDKRQFRHKAGVARGYIIVLVYGPYIVIVAIIKLWYYKLLFR